jgi:xanthine dehydrogenase accessory factor
MLHEVWAFVGAHRRAGRPVVLARLVGRDGPGARPLGATMAVAADGTWSGSLSGGCVEGIVLDAATAVLNGAAAHPMEVAPGEHLMPWEEAPACSGRLRVLITPAPDDPVHGAITAALTHDQTLAVRVSLRPPYPWSTATTARELDDTEAFVEELAQRRRLVLVGATDLAATLAGLAEPLRRKVVVLDPRTTHVRSGAFPSTAEIVRVWPDEWMTPHRLASSDAVVVLSHDPRIDDRGIRAALAAGAGHVAALGSRATHRQRLRRLDGLPGLHRLAAPAGLDLGGASLGDTALSILAGMVAAENGRAGGPLRDGDLSIRAVRV